MKKVVKKTIKSGLKYFGFELRRTRSSPIPQVYREPLEAVVAKKAGKPAAFCCPIGLCVIFNGLSFSSNGWHPFVAAAREYLSGYHTIYKGSILEKYYSVWQPQNALEALVGVGGSPEELLSYPPYMINAPWYNFSHSEMLRLMSNIAKEESINYGKTPLTISDGYGLQGPVSYKKGALEYGRLISVLESIRLKGYDRSLGDVEAHILKSNNQMRFRITHGHHRVSALAALGYDSVTVLPKMLISCDEVESWPHVANNTWTTSQALEYFFHHFEFNSAQWAIDRGLLNC